MNKKRAMIGTFILVASVMIVPICSSTASADVTIESGVKLAPSGSNAQFNVTDQFTVNTVEVESNRIKLEGERFHVDSNSQVWVELSSWYDDNRTFTATCNNHTETVSFTIGGLKDSEAYEVRIKKDGEIIAELKPETNDQGVLTFSHDEWSTNTISIFESEDEGTGGSIGTDDGTTDTTDETDEGTSGTPGLVEYVYNHCFMLIILGLVIVMIIQGVTKDV